MLCTCKADDWYGIACRKPRDVIWCFDCGATIHYNERCWYCALHCPLKLKWIDPTPKNCACGGEYKKVCEYEHECKSCGFIHQAEQPQAGPHAHYIPKSKYNMKYHIRKQLQRLDQKRLVVMRTRQIARIWYSLHQRKLIKLDFILSKIFTRMGLSEQAQRCAFIKKKTPVEYEQLWDTIVDLIQGW